MNSSFTTYQSHLAHLDDLHRAAGERRHADRKPRSRSAARSGRRDAVRRAMMLVRYLRAA